MTQDDFGIIPKVTRYQDCKGPEGPGITLWVRVKYLLFVGTSCLGYIQDIDTNSGEMSTAGYKQTPQNTG